MNMNIAFLRRGLEEVRRRLGDPTQRRFLLAIGGGVLAGGLILHSLLASADPLPQTPATTPATQDQPDPLHELRNAADTCELWMTREQRNRRWQMAKMATLGEMIRSFAAIDTATVLLEPGETQGLGRPAVPPRAIVHLELHDPTALTSELLAAVADTVSHAVTGLDPDDICIVDSHGRSFRYNSAGPGDVASQRARLEEARQQYLDRIHTMLDFLPDVSAVVDVVPQGDGYLCRSVVVSLPKGHGVAAYAGRNGNTDQSLIAFLKTEAEGIRRIVAHAVAVPEERVEVFWRPTPAPAAPRIVTPRSHEALRLVVVALLAALETALVTTIVIRRIRRRRRRQAWTRVRALARRRRSRLVAGRSCGLFEALKQTSVEDLVTLLEPEPPAMIALALSQLSPARAARVLAGLSAARQVEVTQQLARFDRIDTGELRSVEQKLAARLEALEPQENSADPRTSGVGTVARILQHTGQNGRKKVLDALHRQAPELAESIGRKLLGFEDVVRMEPDHLAPALADMPPEDIALSVWTAEDDLRDAVLAVLSEETRREVRNQLDTLGPVRLSQVESAQQRLVEAVREHQAGQHSDMARSGQALMA